MQQPRKHIQQQGKKKQKVQQLKLITNLLIYTMQLQQSHIVYCLLLYLAANRKLIFNINHQVDLQMINKEQIFIYKHFHQEHQRQQDYSQSLKFLLNQYPTISKFVAYLNYFEVHSIDKYLLAYTYISSKLKVSKQNKVDFDQHLLQQILMKILELLQYCNPQQKLVSRNNNSNYNKLVQGNHYQLSTVDQWIQFLQLRSVKQNFPTILFFESLSLVILQQTQMLIIFVANSIQKLLSRIFQVSLLIIIKKILLIIKNSTMKAINVHPNQQEIYLGFASKETLSNEQKNFEVSFIGGQPIWLFEPQYKQLRCEKCTKNQKSKKQEQVEISQDNKAQLKSEDIPNKISQKQTQINTYELTFIMQMYCPLQADHCYHRILYFFYCQHCKKNYKLFRQQADINYVPPQSNSKKSKHSIKTILQKSYQFDTSQFSKKQLVKLLNNIKIQVHQEIIQQADDQDSQEDESLKEIVKIPQQFEQDKNPQNEELIKQENVQSSLNIKKDQNFQVYKKVMIELNQPQLLYVSPSIPYNVVPINAKHSCQQCGAPYKLQVQLTEQILLVGKSKQLALMDWGSLFGFTCVASCVTKTNLKIQQLVVQYQHDPVKEQQVKQLKKKNKKRKKQQKRKSKSKSHSKSHSQQQQSKPTQNIRTQQQGDWD